MQLAPLSPTDSRSAESSSFSSAVWKRFQSSLDAPLPLIALDAEGTIVDLTPEARALLDYSPNAELDPCFFTHVHGRNLEIVMRDLAHMVCYRKQQASWLLRMRTGKGRWRWYRASARPLPDASSPRILVRLRKV
jgi:PAS domain-containing protein